MNATLWGRYALPALLGQAVWSQCGTIALQATFATNGSAVAGALATAYFDANNVTFAARRRTGAGGGASFGGCTGAETRVQVGVGGWSARGAVQVEPQREVALRVRLQRS